MMTRSQDTEITLGTGKMVAIFFGLVALCAVFFSFGFKMGKDSVISAPTTQAASSVVGGPRPSAAKSGSSPAPVSTSPAGQQADKDTDATGVTPPSSSQDIGPAGGSYYVQVAAVSKQEDADALVESLRKKQYPALATSTADKLFHVQVGPYGDIKDAEAIRAKLVGDGYNPILKK